MQNLAEIVNTSLEHINVLPMFLPLYHFNCILQQTNGSLSFIGAQVEAEVNSSVTLMCPSENRNYVHRNWYRGYFTHASEPPTREKPLFRQLSTRVLSRITARADMSVDPSTFALTIGNLQPKDDGYFTCRILDEDTSQNIYEHSKVDLFSKLKLDWLHTLQ